MNTQNSTGNTKSPVFTQMTDIIVNTDKDLALLMRAVQATSNNAIANFDKISKLDFKSLQSLYLANKKQYMDIHDMERVNKIITLDPIFENEYLEKRFMEYSSHQDNAVIKNRFIYIYILKNVVDSLLKLLLVSGSYEWGTNQNNINLEFDRMFKCYFHFQKVWNERTANFHNNFSSIASDSNKQYGSGAAQMFLYAAEGAATRWKLEKNRQYHYTRDEIISQGYLIHKFDQKVINENPLLRAGYIYENYMLDEFVKFVDFHFEKDIGPQIVRNTGIRMTTGLVWSGILDTDLSNSFANVTLPLGFTPVLLIAYMAGKNIRQLFQGNSIFEENQDKENKLKLDMTDMISRNALYMSEEYVEYDINLHLKPR